MTLSRNHIHDYFDETVLARNLMKDKKYSEALVILEKLYPLLLKKDLKKLTLTVELLRAKCFTKQDNFDKAFKILSKVKEQYSTFSADGKKRVIEDFASYWMSVFKRNGKEEYLEKYRDYVEKLPQDDPYTKQLWIEYHNKKSNFSKALDLISQVQNEYNNDQVLWEGLQFKRAIIYRRLGRKSDFIEAAKKLDRNTKNIKIRQILSEANLRPLMDEEIKTPPSEDPEDRMHFALMIENSAPQEAEDIYKKLLKESPYDWQNYITYAVHLQLTSEDWKRSIEILELLKKKYNAFRKDQTISKINKETMMASEQIWLSACTSYAIACYNLGEFETGDQYVKIAENYQHAPAYSTHAKYTTQLRSKVLYQYAHEIDPKRLQRLHGEALSHNSINLLSEEDFPSLSKPVNVAAKKEKEKESQQEVSLIKQTEFYEAMVELELTQVSSSMPSVKKWSFPQQSMTTSSSLRQIMKEEEQNKEKKTWNKEPQQKASLIEIMQSEKGQSLVEQDQVKPMQVNSGKKFNKKTAIKFSLTTSMRQSVTSKPVVESKEIDDSKLITVSASDQLLNDSQVIRKDEVGEISEPNESPIESSMQNNNGEILEPNQLIQPTSQKTDFTDTSIVTPTSEVKQSTQSAKRQNSFCNSLSIFATSAVLVAAATTYYVNEYVKKM